MEETTMLARTVFGFIVMMSVLVQAGNMEGKDNIQKYFNDTARKVKATTDPAQKRDILNKSLQTMSKALDKVESSGLIMQDDRAGVDRFTSTLKEKQDELTGSNGYERVSDAQLNAFSDYIVQDMEQAERYITVSVVTVLLVVIILLLI
jgi:septal ring factor EnvC (AmiA/AmiB activator)